MFIGVNVPVALYSLKVNGNPYIKDLPEEVTPLNCITKLFPI